MDFVSLTSSDWEKGYFRGKSIKSKGKWKLESWMNCEQNNFSFWLGSKQEREKFYVYKQVGVA